MIKIIHSLQKILISCLKQRVRGYKDWHKLSSFQVRCNVINLWPHSTCPSHVGVFGISLELYKCTIDMSTTPGFWYFSLACRVLLKSAWLPVLMSNIFDRFVAVCDNQKRETHSDCICQNITVLRRHLASFNSSNVKIKLVKPCVQMSASVCLDVSEHHERPKLSPNGPRWPNSQK